MGGRTSDRDEQEIRVTDRRRIYLDEDRDSATDDAAAAPPSLKPKYVEELEARTQAAEAQVQDVKSRFEQLRAEMQRETDATRQRLNRAADERAQRENANFITALLPVLDNLQRAILAAENASSNDLLAEGVRRILESFEKALLDAGVEAVSAVGQDFDPELHEAVETVAVEPELEGKVVAEHARGYTMGGRLLRPAKVKVGRAAVKFDGVAI